ncbi:MAG: ABC transporter permease subunit [Clostridia bacterium]|nr:ABC transporter permease subunit [Clostridia bacterium]
MHMAKGKPSTADLRKHHALPGGHKRQLAFLMMLLPGIAFLICFSYLPMPGIIMAFKNYRLAIPPKDFWIQNRFIYSVFVQNPWVGLTNFKFLTATPDGAMILRNTVGYNLLFMVTGLVLSVGLAVVIHELRNRRAAKVYHTILFLPYFISWIVVSYALYALISTTGMFNQIARATNSATINYYTKVQYWPYIFWIANIWKYTGNGSIIYLATLTGFDQDLYEAAAIDGAGKWRQFWTITLPQLMPTIVLLQILAIGRFFNSDFDMFFSLPNGSGILRNATNTIDVYVYHALSGGSQMGYAAAGAFFQSTVGFILVLTTNMIVRRVEPDMSLF